MNKIRRIAVGTDFSMDAGVAVRQAMHLARHLDAELILVHCYPMTQAQLNAHEQSLGRAEEFRAALRDAMNAAHDRLEALHEQLSGQGVVVSQVLADSPADKGIIQAAEELNADLVMVGSHGRTGFKRLLLGSVAEKVVRDCPVSVIVCRPPEVKNGFKKLLLPTDLTARTDAAVELANVLGAKDASNELLHCWMEPIPIVYEAGITTAGLVEEIRDNAYKKTEALRDRLTAPEHELTANVIAGRPVPSIVEHLGNGAYDLVVMNSHGRRGLKRLVLGSVAEGVVRHAPCSVAVVREKTDA